MGALGAQLCDDHHPGSTSFLFVPALNVLLLVIDQLLPIPLPPAGGTSEQLPMLTFTLKGLNVSMVQDLPISKPYSQVRRSDDIARMQVLVVY